MASEQETASQMSLIGQSAVLVAVLAGALYFIGVNCVEAFDREIGLAGRSDIGVQYAVAMGYISIWYILAVMPAKAALFLVMTVIACGLSIYDIRRGRFRHTNAVYITVLLLTFVALQSQLGREASRQMQRERVHDAQAFLTEGGDAPRLEYLEVRCVDETIDATPSVVSGFRLTTSASYFVLATADDVIGIPERNVLSYRIVDPPKPTN